MADIRMDDTERNSDWLRSREIMVTCPYCKITSQASLWDKATRAKLGVYPSIEAEGNEDQKYFCPCCEIDLYKDELDINYK